MKHCLLKLRTGDDVIGRFLEEDDDTILIEDAMVVDVTQHDYGTSIFVSRWAPFSDDKVVIINKDSIISSLNLRKSMADYYEECVESYYKRFEADIDEQIASSESVDPKEFLEDSDELDRYLDQVEQTMSKAEESANTTVH